jgi:hypothetical protein
MVAPPRVAASEKAGAGDADFIAGPVLAETLHRCRQFQLYLEVLSSPSAPSGCVGASALLSPVSPELESLQHSFRLHGLAPNKKAGSASLLLRFGWAAGFAITAYLACGRVPLLRNYAIQFGPTMLLRALWVGSASFIGRSGDPLAGQSDWVRTVTPRTLRECLVESLIAFTEPVVVAQHAWSGFSRRALWAMVTSSWAEQFASVARQMGDESSGVREARLIFGALPELQRAAPELYEVASHGRTRTCQRRAACCLYFKSDKRYFCASCPIVPEAERLERNRDWVARSEPSGRPSVLIR